MTNKNNKAQTKALIAASPKLLKLGLDVHSQTISMVVVEGETGPKPAQRFARKDFMRWIQKKRQEGYTLYSCYEAGPLGFHLHRQLAQHEVTNYVVAPKSLNTGSVKTDARDARELALSLDYYLRGNKKALHVIHVLTEQQERRRDLVRHRASILKMRKRIVSQGAARLLLQGISENYWYKPGVWDSLLPKLDDTTRLILKDLHEQVEFYQKKEREFTELIKAEADTSKELPIGEGVLSAEMLDREIGDWSRFKNRRHVSSYTGLCPSEYSTGTRRRQGSINRQGNRHLRAILVEMAWRIRRWQPQYVAVQKCFGRLPTNASGAAKKRAVVALARRLAVDLWRLATNQTTPENLKLEIVRSA